ncbi:AfsR/SARP family transcriptional regulator [Streptomyces massasporeus]|uniref:AfsR/SARP family transcriptional regulator n=1 Tax=Streptomyces massasporeus TaxID=67324 RepID=UPI0037B9CFA9
MEAERAGESVQFSLLGPVRVWRSGGELHLGPRQQRLMLAVLLARAGRAVSLGEFIDLLWSNDPPNSAANAVHRHIGALRRVIEPDLPPRSPGQWLVRQADGYLLRVDADCFDLLNFRNLVEQARRCVDAGDLEAGVGVFTTALAMWQRRCAAGLEPASLTHPTLVMLEHEYVSVVCEAASTALRCQQPGRILLPLRQAAERNPLDEALLAHLLLVLAADGKQAEAIQLYRTVRTRLANELGVDPGAELRAAYERVLHQQAAENGPAGPVHGYGPPQLTDLPGASHGLRDHPIRPAQLPPDLRCFVGREPALARATKLIRERRSAPNVLVIDGIPGIGKTALAVRLGHRLAAEFPDAQLYVDLRGFAADATPADPHDVLHGFLGALGVSQQRIPASADMRAALYRSVLAGRRVLIVLDNARDAGQVRPLLPGTPEAAVLVTSRSRLTTLATAHGAHLFTLEVPDRDEVTAAYLERVREFRTDAELEVVQDIVERCGRLPLAVAIAAARAAARPEQPLAQMAAELSNTRESLEGLSDDTLDNDVSGVFSWSYRTLSPQAARTFRLVSLHSGPDVTVDAVASLTGRPPHEVGAAMRELVRARLFTRSRNDRYWSHDLLLAYAAELNRRTDPDRTVALERLHDHYHQTAHAAHLMLQPPTPPLAPAPPLTGVTPEPIADRTAAAAWFTAEHKVLRAIVEGASKRGEATTAWRLALLMQLFYQCDGRWHEWADVMRTALEVARRAGDTEGVARTEHSLAGALMRLDDTDEALRHIDSARDHFQKLGSTRELAHVLKSTGAIHSTRGEHAAAHRCLEQALKLIHTDDQPGLKAATLVWAGHSRLNLADAGKATSLAQEALKICRETGNVISEAASLRLLAMVRRVGGDSARAVALQENCLELLRLVGNRTDVAEGLMELGDMRLDAGDAVGARRAWGEILACAGSFDDTPLVSRAQERLRKLAQ